MPALGSIKPQHQPGGRRLSRTALADEAEGLALADREAHAVDGSHVPDHPTEDLRMDREVNGEVAHVEQRSAVRDWGSLRVEERSSPRPHRTLQVSSSASRTQREFRPQLRESRLQTSTA